MERYFDYAAGTPVADDVLSAMLPYFSTEFYNPSSIYSSARGVKDRLEDARGLVAHQLDARKEEIIFTSGCTEANNLAIQGVMASYPDKKILFSAIEHDSVQRPAELYNNATIPVTTAGIIDLEAFDQLMDGEVVLVSVMYINNEIGTVQPLRKIAERIKAERLRRGKDGLPLFFHCDAAQAPNTQPISISATEVDLLSLSGAKIYGPKGVGCLYVRHNVALKPLLLGGGQEYGRRSGTENVALIQGFALSLQTAVQTHKEEQARLSILNSKLRDGLLSIGGILLTSETPSVTSVLFPDFDNEYLVYALDTKGFQISSGSACHASTDEDSKVLSALGLDKKAANQIIRISLGRYSEAESVDDLIKNIKEILANKQA